MLIKNNTTNLSITLKNKTLKELDNARGITPRSTTIECILSEFLSKKRRNSSKSIITSTFNGKF